MESPQEREERIVRLDRQRAERRASFGPIPATGGGNTVWPTPDDAGTGVIPLEVGPGRGDLNYSSGFVPTFPTALALVGNRALSFARIFMSQPWIYACVTRMLTYAIRVPLKTYRKSGDENSRERVLPGEHPLASMIEKPWDRGSTVDFLLAALGAYFVHGNAVFDIQTNRDGSLSLIEKDWRHCMPIMPYRDTLAGFAFDVDIPSRRYEETIDKVLHVRSWSPVGPIGTSPLQALGVTLQIEDAAQRFQRALFQNGTRPPSAITASEAFMGIDPKERQAILRQVRQDLTAIYSGPDNAGKPALLPFGLTWNSVGQTTNEAELIEQRKITREEICGVYLMPPTLVGILQYAIKSNIQEQRAMAYTDCLGPPLVLLEALINSQIARDLLHDDEVFVEFDFSAVLRGNRIEQIGALRDAVGSAMINPNEAREELAMPRVDDPSMDRYYLPVNNLQPIGTPASSGGAQTDAGVPQAPDSPLQVLHVRSRDADYVLQGGNRASS